MKTIQVRHTCLVVFLSLSIALSGLGIITPQLGYAADDPQGSAIEANTPVDTSALEEAIAAVPDDLSLFTSDSVQALNKALDAVNLEDPNLTQTMVDQWTADIQRETRLLEYAYLIANGTKTYDGTNVVTIHVPFFSGVFYQDEVYGDGIATVSSPNAGSYTTCSWDNLQFGGGDLGWYDMSEVANVENARANITIERAIADLSIKAPESVEPGEEFQVQVTINNDFGNETGLPDISQIEITSENASVKPGSITRSGNVYTATMIVNDAIDSEQLTVSTNVAYAAQNYAPATADAVASIKVENNHAPEATTPESNDPNSSDATQTTNQPSSNNNQSKLPQTSDNMTLVGIAALVCVVLASAGIVVSRRALRK